MRGAVLCGALQARCCLSIERARMHGFLHKQVGITCTLCPSLRGDRFCVILPACRPGCLCWRPHARAGHAEAGSRCAGLPLSEAVGELSQRRQQCETVHTEHANACLLALLLTTALSSPGYP